MPTEIKALVSPTWLWGVTRLGGGAWVGLVLPGNRDGAISTARLYATSLGSTKSKQAISSQCAGDSRLVHVRRQAVAAAELTGDVAVIILRSQTTKTAKYKKKALLISLFAHICHEDVPVQLLENSIQCVMKVLKYFQERLK